MRVSDLVYTFERVTIDEVHDEMSGRNGHIGVFRPDKNDVLFFGGQDSERQESFKDLFQLKNIGRQTIGEEEMKVDSIYELVKMTDLVDGWPKERNSHSFT